MYTLLPEARCICWCSVAVPMMRTRSRSDKDRDKERAGPQAQWMATSGEHVAAMGGERMHHDYYRPNDVIHPGV